MTVAYTAGRVSEQAATKSGSGSLSCARAETKTKTPAPSIRVPSWLLFQQLGHFGRGLLLKAHVERRQRLAGL
jgi:hypothetical protein